MDFRYKWYLQEISGYISNTRCAFRNLSNIYDGFFLQIFSFYQRYFIMRGSSCLWFGWCVLLQKRSIKFDQDIWVLWMFYKRMTKLIAFFFFFFFFELCNFMIYNPTIHNPKMQNSGINYLNMFLLCTKKTCIWKTIFCRTNSLTYYSM